MGGGCGCGGQKLRYFQMEREIGERERDSDLTCGGEEGGGGGGRRKRGGCSERGEEKGEEKGRRRVCPLG